MTISIPVLIIFITLDFVIGFVLGFAASSSDEIKSKIDDEEILLDAETNRMISEMKYSSSQKKRIFDRLDRAINCAAKQGDTSITISFEFNQKIERVLTKKEITEHYEPLGYQVSFKYEYIMSSQIERISWNA